MRRALGKGLAQLLGETAESQPATLPLSMIRPNPKQPRTHFDPDSLQELADSIKQFGLLQPIVVRPISENVYEIVAGERRYRASKLLNLTEIPVIVRSVDDATTLQLALIENVQREDISPIECAIAFRSLVEDFGLRQEDVAKKVGKSRVAISNTMRLLRLPPQIQQSITEGLLTEGHGRALLGIEHPGQQNELFLRIVDESLSVREAERLVKRIQGGDSGKPGGAGSAVVQQRDAKSKATSAEIRALEEALATQLGSPATIKMNANGGQITVDFYGDDDLQRLLDILNVKL